jgi:tetratricopeptide (TPR) repeat protein
MRISLKTALICCALYVISPHFSAAQGHVTKHGTVDLQTSCSEAAQQRFDNGLALMHHMMYDQAEQEFAAAAQAAPDCGMAQWGIAMSYIHPLWGERPSDDDFRKGQAAVEKARQQKNLTAKEKAYITAVSRFYEDWENTSYSDQLKAFEQGYREAYKAYPEEVEAAAFYALGQLGTAPKTDNTFAKQKEAGALLEQLHARHPNHPGLFHYIIHAYDNPMLAKRAVKVSREYERIAPDVPHALHMPSHIFIRLGQWTDAIDWNMRSADAALRQSSKESMSMHYPHALDYMAYGYLQQGRDKKAQQVVEKMQGMEGYAPAFATAYALAAIPARHALERGKWEEAAALPVRAPENFAWDKYPGAEAITHFARGIGGARSGNTAVAEEAVASLGKLREQLGSSGDTYWAAQAEAQQLAVQAWLAYQKGDKDKGLAMMREAADKEDALDKHPVTPGAVLPARELLGDMLLMSKKPAEAMQAYEASLKVSPKRYNSLYGAALSAEKAKDRQKAKSYYLELLEISPEADGDRESWAQAKKYTSRK